MKAYITLLSTLSYLPGVIVLHESLRQTGTSYLFCVAISKDIPEHIGAGLKKRGLRVIRLPESIQIPEYVKENSGHWSNTFDKLHLFGLTEFEKLVYLDSDMLVLKNIDELFEMPHLSAVAAGRLEHPDWIRLNSGLMVIEPEYQLPEKMAGMLQQAIDEKSSMGIDAVGDQDIINAYFPDWPEAIDLHLDDGYNLFCSHMDSYINNHGYSLPGESDGSGKEIQVVHFIGRHKPWMKWAGLRSFLNICKKRNSVKWERKIFLMYGKFFKTLKLQKDFSL